MNKNANQLSSNNFSYQEEVLNIFNDRVKEIDLFFELIDKFEAVNPAQLISVDANINLLTESDLVIDNGESLEITIRNILQRLNLETPNVDLINIFKSNSILLLYNLIESTVSNTDKFILKTITNANILYADAIPKIRSFWIEYIAKFDKKEYLNVAVSMLDGIQTLKIDIEKQANDNEKEFQGNLDPRAIDAMLDRYGIETTKPQMLTQETERTAVKNVVTWRNDLAHGKYSFAEFGRNRLRYNDLTQRNKEADILFIKNACFLFLEIFLTNVEKYIDNESYKR